MQILLQDHNYRYAVEQTVMVLLPQEKIETTVEYDEKLPYLSTYFGKQRDTAYCIYFDGKNTHYGTSTDEKALKDIRRFWVRLRRPSKEEIEAVEVKLFAQEQFLIKDAIYSAIVPTLDKEPPWGSLTGVRPVKMASKLLEQGEDVVAVLCEKYHLQPIRAKLAYECAKVSQDLQKIKGVSLYVGIPFCPSRCHYCSFFSSDIQGNEEILPVYIKALITEIQEKIALIGEEPIASIYLGGGTPTVCSASQLAEILSQLSNLGAEEFTVEAGRADTLCEEKYAVMEKYGVTRISINPQTMKEETLVKLGRGHTVAEVLTQYQLCHQRFLVNMDLIAGLSGETEGDFLDSLDQVIKLRPNQITVHSLTPKKNTPLTQEGEPEDSPEDWQTALDKGWEKLRKAGYLPYYLYRQKKITQGLENVGWALPQKRGKPQASLYNVAMMEEFQTIYGCGCGAMTKMVGDEGISRKQNPKFTRDYLRLQENPAEKGTGKDSENPAEKSGATE